MICPNCSCHDRVTRTLSLDTVVRRERRCPACGYIRVTEEKPVVNEVKKTTNKKKKKTAEKTETEPSEPPSKPSESAEPKGALAKALANAK